MKTIDIKSLLIGILATVLVMVTVGAVGKPDSQIGRYQATNWKSPTMKADGSGNLCIILDTATGKTWGRGTNGERAPRAGRELVWDVMMSPLK